MTINNIKTTLLALVFLTSAAAAAPQAWFHPDGTLHYYEAISVPDGISWDEANLLSSNSGGYLATVTSQAENDLIFDLVDDPSYWYQRDGGIQNGPFFGGFQLDGSVEPAGGWRWISGEDFMYTNWGQNQPSNTNNDQNRVFFGGTETNRTSTWSDISKNISLLSGFVVEYSAEEQTMGLFQYDVAASFEGYNLFAPQNSNNVYLIDNWGRLVNEWVTESDQGNSAYLLENGHLLRTVQIDNERFAAGGYTGKIEEYDWDGNLIWEFTHSSDTYMHHHDLAYLPNGNVLILAWELKTEEEAIQAGRDPEKLPEGELWPDYIFEVEPTFPSGGNIVWEWHVWDHMIQDFDATKDNFGVVEDHPELIDVNFHSHGTYVADWQHGNAIDYNAELDQIIYSVWGFDEFWIIDHSTTSEESAAHTGGNRGKGGDLLYRWGNPLAYRAGALEDQKLFNQHNPHWIASSLPGAGNILVFNNGNGRIGGNYSSVEELTLPSDGFGNYIMPLPGEAFGPEEPTWMYVAEPPETFYAAFISGASRQPNGNTLICSGPQGKLFEVTSVGEKVWEYIVPVGDTGVFTQGQTIPGTGALENMTFRVYRYAPEYSAFNGFDLTPLKPIENYPAPTPVVVQTTPLVSLPVIPVQGGDLEFDLYLENISAGTQSFDAWIGIAYEAEEPVTVAQRNFIGSGAGWILDREGLRYPIPAEYAAGEYTFAGNVGRYPNAQDESGFSFVKEGETGAGSFQPFPVVGAPNPFDDVTTADGSARPAKYSLLGNYPNPFNPTTTIQFSLEYAGVVKLNVYDLQGRLVNTLVDGFRSNGVHDVTFDAANLSSGVYFYSLSAGDFNATGKMILMK